MSVSDSDQAGDVTWSVAHYIEQGTFSVNLNDALVNSRRRFVTQLTRHLLSLKNFTWELGVTDGARLSVCL